MPDRKEVLSCDQSIEEDTCNPRWVLVKVAQGYGLPIQIEKTEAGYSQVDWGSAKDQIDKILLNSRFQALERAFEGQNPYPDLSSWGEQMRRRILAYMYERRALEYFMHRGPDVEYAVRAANEERMKAEQIFPGPERPISPAGMYSLVDQVSRSYFQP